MANAKKILVTGGLGYIGSHTTIELLSSGYEPIIVDNLCNSKIEALNRIEKISGVRPVFVDNQTDMIVPSTVKMGSVSDTDWYEVNSTTVTGETASEVGYTPVDNRIDMYFIYEVTAVNGADNWALFGFPYDFLDAKSRLIIRINENNNNRLDGYIYGASLGDAGAEGTYFNVDESYNFRLKTDPLLVHISIVDNGSNNITFTIEFTNLVNGKVGSVTKSVTFTEYSAQTWARNKMCLIPATGCEWRFKDAF